MTPCIPPGLHGQPAILCLHGGGTNSDIFEFQTAKLRRMLASRYQFIFADGPVRSRPGPGVLPFFQGCGPFRRWVRDRFKGTEDEKARALEEDEGAAERALAEALDGRSQKIVGVMGFSVGGGMAAALLERGQRMLAGHRETGQAAKAWEDLEFGIFLMGTPPSWGAVSRRGEEMEREMVRLPTVHVHGLRDPWLEQSRVLFRHCVGEETGSAELLEFDVGHEVNFSEQEYRDLVCAILLAAQRGAAMV